MVGTSCGGVQWHKKKDTHFFGGAASLVPRSLLNPGVGMCGHATQGAWQRC